MTKAVATQKMVTRGKKSSQEVKVKINQKKETILKVKVTKKSTKIEVKTGQKDLKNEKLKAGQVDSGKKKTAVKINSIPKSKLITPKQKLENLKQGQVDIGKVKKLVRSDPIPKKKLIVSKIKPKRILTTAALEKTLGEIEKLKVKSKIKPLTETQKLRLMKLRKLIPRKPRVKRMTEFGFKGPDWDGNSDDEGI
jgi:hypothetical protein